MRRIKSTQEVLRSPFVTRAEIKRTFHFSRSETAKVFSKAAELDRKKPTPGWHIVEFDRNNEPTKVSLKSVYEVIGSSVEETMHTLKMTEGL